mgnify:CR=1 FL=1
MKIYVVIASINELRNIPQLLGRLGTASANEVEIIVVDEGDASIRKRNRYLLSDFSFRFYGPKGRKRWFKQRFGATYERYLSVIPRRCHAETSLITSGLLRYSGLLPLF